MKNPLFVFAAVLFFLSPLVVFGANQIDAGTIVSAYNHNRLAADESYKSRRLTVKGIVRDIGQKKDGQYFVLLADDEIPGSSLNFYFDPAEKKRIMSLSNGQEIVIEGDCQGSPTRGRNVEFNQSVLVTAVGRGGTVDKDGSLADLMPSLVTIEGSKGNGSGFIADWEGKKVVVTNMHVLLNCGELKLTDGENNELDPTVVRFSRDRDLVLVELKNYTRKGLKIAAHFDAEMMNQPIRIYGNSMGAGVNTTLSGSVVGVGPKKIEITAPIVEGNSGSPIIVNGEVIGVATSMMLPDPAAITRGSRFYDIRRFGVRLDGLKSDHFQEYVAELYKKDFRQQKMVQHFCEMMALFLCDPWRPNAKVDILAFEKYPEILPLVKEWNALIVTNDRYANDPKYSVYASNAKFTYLLGKKLRPLFEIPFKKIANYKFHYQFMGETVDNYLDFYAKMMGLYGSYENRFALAGAEEDRERKKTSGNQNSAFGETRSNRNRL